jgi:hypothetical protein
MFNLLGIGSNLPVKAALGAVLIVIGVTRHATLLIVAGVLVLASVAIAGARSRRGAGGDGPR